MPLFPSSGSGSGAHGLSVRVLTLLDGNNQAAITGDPLTNPLRVRLIDGASNPIAGVTPDWAISGDGQVTASGPTDVSGIAVAVVVSVGTTLGTVVVTATVPGAVGSPTFAITVTASAATTIEMLDGDDQSSVVGNTVPTAPEVIVKDAQGAPVAGFPVVFGVGSGGGSVVGGSTTTDAQGIARPTSWTLGPAVGPNTLVATAALSGSPITFSASGTAATATQVLVGGGDGQTVIAGAAAGPISAIVKDAGNNPLQGQTVLWTIVQGGGSLSAPSSVTSAAGIASIGYTAGTVSGTAIIRATVGAITLDFTITKIAGTATQLFIFRQPSGSGQSNVALAQQPAIQLRDANGNDKAQAGVTVTASKATGPDTIGGTLTRVTDANGLADFALNVGAGIKYTGSGTDTTRFAVTVPSSFNVVSGPTTLVPPVVASIRIVQQPTNVVQGGTIQPAVTVEVLDSGGVRILGNTLQITASKATGTGALSGTLVVDAINGLATFSNLSPATASSWSLNFNAASVPQITSNVFTVSAGGGGGSFNEPQDVTLVAQIDTEWLGEPLDTPFVNPSVHSGWNAQTNASNLTVRRTSDQSWLPAGITAFPAAPSGDDRVLVCQFTTNLAGTKGKLYKVTSGQNAKTAYVRARVCLSSNWRGHTSGSFKYLILFISGTGGHETILKIDGAGLGPQNIRLNYQPVGAPAEIQAQCRAISRNVWTTIEVMWVLESALSAGDGHFTVWVDNVMEKQVTGIPWRTGGTNLIQQLEMHFYGGAGNATPPQTNIITTDGIVYKTSTARAAVPT